MSLPKARKIKILTLAYSSHSEGLQKSWGRTGGLMSQNDLMRLSSLPYPQNLRVKAEVPSKPEIISVDTYFKALVSKRKY